MLCNVPVILDFGSVQQVIMNIFLL